MKRNESESEKEMRKVMRVIFCSVIINEADLIE